MNESEHLLHELAKKVDDFVFDHSIFPNAILLPTDEIDKFLEMDRKEIKDKLPTIAILIPIDSGTSLDLPLPVLLPVIATKLQRERAIILENKEL